MSEGTGEGTNATGAGTGAAPAWTAQLPSELRENSAFTSFKTIGDLAKSHLELGSKVKDYDGMKAKLADSIPKLTDDATDEEKEVYYASLGRPDNAEGYEFDGDDLDRKSVTWARDTFFKAGLTKEQAKNISGAWNGFLKEMVAAETATRKSESEAAETKLRAELGDKYEPSLEMVRRMWQKHTSADFDAFVNETKIGNHPLFIRFMLGIAKTTGEDTSPAGSPRPAAKAQEFNPTEFYKTVAR